MKNKVLSWFVLGTIATVSASFSVPASGSGSHMTPKLKATLRGATKTSRFDFVATYQKSAESEVIQKIQLQRKIEAFIPRDPFPNLAQVSDVSRPYLQGTAGIQELRFLDSLPIDRLDLQASPSEIGISTALSAKLDQSSINSFAEMSPSDESSFIFFLSDRTPDTHKKVDSELAGCNLKVLDNSVTGMILASGTKSAVRKAAGLSGVTKVVKEIVYLQKP